MTLDEYQLADFGNELNRWPNSIPGVVFRSVLRYTRKDGIEHLETSRPYNRKSDARTWLTRQTKLVTWNRNAPNAVVTHDGHVEVAYDWLVLR